MSSSPQAAHVPEKKAALPAPSPQPEPKKKKFFITIVSQIPV
jgi:hypothetical protein